MPYKLALVLSTGGAAETPYNHVLACVVSGVPDGDVLEQTAVCPKNVIYKGPHQPPLTENATCPEVSRPWGSAQKEVAGSVLQPYI